jgi:sialic acid synthase
MKGTDQAGSLGPDGINRMMRDLRALELSFGKEEIFVEPGVESARVKLERSVATRRAIRKGETVSEADIHLLSPGDGVKWIDRHTIIGRTATVEIPEDEIIYPHMLS